MGIPEEDKGPAWLRDYGENSGHLTTDRTWGYQTETGTFAADLDGLRDFGKKLNNELELDYVPHVKAASEYMAAQPSVLPARFFELSDVVQRQSVKLQEVLGNLKNHYLGVQAIAAFATDIAEKYGNTDALAAASITDVENGLLNTAAVKDPNGGQIPAPLDNVTSPANQQTEPTGGGYE